MRTALILAGLVAVGVGGAGCLNLGGGRQLVTLPWSYPAVAMDATGSQIKNGAQAGAQFAGEGPSVPTTGDQVMTIGQNQSNQRSTDASLADEQSQAVGQQSPGSAIDSSTGKTLDKKATPTVNIGPAGGAQIGNAAGDVPTAVPAAADLTDAEAAALLKRLREAQAAADAAKATP